MRRGSERCRGGMAGENMTWSATRSLCGSPRRRGDGDKIVVVLVNRTVDAVSLGKERVEPLD